MMDGGVRPGIPGMGRGGKPPPGRGSPASSPRGGLPPQASPTGGTAPPPGRPPRTQPPSTPTRGNNNSGGMGPPPSAALPTPPLAGPPEMALPSLPPVTDLPPLPTAPAHGGGNFRGGGASSPGHQPPHPHHQQNSHHSAGNSGGGAHHTLGALPTRNPVPTQNGGADRRSATMSQGGNSPQPPRVHTNLSHSQQLGELPKMRPPDPRLQKRMSEDNLKHHAPFTPFPVPAGGTTIGNISPPTTPDGPDIPEKKEKKTRKLMAMGGNLRDKIKTKIMEKGDKKDQPDGPAQGNNVPASPNKVGLAVPPIMGMPMPMPPSGEDKTTLDSPDGKKGKKDPGSAGNRLSRAFGRKRNDSIDEGESGQPASPRGGAGTTINGGPVQGSVIGGPGGFSPGPVRPISGSLGGSLKLSTGGGAPRSPAPGFAMAGMSFAPPGASTSFDGSGMNGGPPHDPLPSKPETPFERRTKIANELLSTERTYVQALRDLMTFQEPLMQLASLPDNNVTPDSVARLFGTLPQIIPLNSELLNQLEARMSMWDENATVGDIFEKMAPFLKMYKDYENGYDLALNTYTELMSDVAFKNQIDIELSKKPSAQIETILIMPVQRIPRYLMLLQDLLKHTPISHIDHSFLQRAVGLVEQVANSLDKDLQDNEQRQRYMELSMATGAVNLLAAHRKLVREGEVSTFGTFGNLGVDRLNILLFNDILVPFPNSKLSKLGGEKWLNHKRAVIARPENQWPLELVWLTDIEPTEKDKNSFKFQITGPGRSFVIVTKTLEDKLNWWNCFAEAIEVHVNTPTPGQDPAREINKAMGPKRIGAYQFKNKVRYCGEWVTGNIEGRGTMEIFGCRYEGNFSKNSRKGMGKLTYSTGEVYDGEWIEDLQNGTGTMTYPTGDKYTGCWKAGLRSSKGKMVYANGDVYNGNWEENLPHGQGNLVCANGLTYAGQFAMGQFHGKGTLSMPNGMEYVGDWVHGDRDGNGALTQYDKDRTYTLLSYTGIWRKNMKAERGTLIDANGTYVGEFVRDLMEGQGRMEYQDGSVYDGQWKGGIREGLGTFKSPDTKARVRSYEGEWKDDKKHGRGRLVYNNGNVYDGQFKKDLLHGNGALYYATGEIYEGKWVRDVWVGPATYTFNQQQSEAARKVGGEPLQTGENEVPSALIFNGSTNSSIIAASKKVFFPIAPPVADLTFTIKF